MDLDKSLRENQSNNTVRIPIEDLKEIVNKLLITYNIPGEQAEIISDCLIEADACGVTTHGISILATQINKIQSGGYNLFPKFNVIREGAAFAVIDADNAIGYVSAVSCMEYAIKKAKETGIFTVLSRNSNTYGPAFYYTLLAAKKEMIGITFCNSPAAMPAWEGKEKLLGTNPFSISVPCKEHNPIIFDMATSKVAKSKLNEARLRKKEIPLGWALDEHGNPTTDPLEAIKGFMMPMEGYKGYGLALSIDILAGVLSGAAFLNNVGKFYNTDSRCMNVGQTFIAIDPIQIYGEDFYKVMDEYVDKIKSSKSIENSYVRVPGDGKAKYRDVSMINGIEIDIKIFEALNKRLF